MRIGQYVMNCLRMWRRVLIGINQDGCVRVVNGVCCAGVDSSRLSSPGSREGSVERVDSVGRYHWAVLVAGSK